MADTELHLLLRSRSLALDETGHQVWQVAERPVTLHPAATALVLCDVWDRHWCRGANERLAAMLPRMTRVVDAARGEGVLLVHAPSGTMDFYANHPARLRALDAPAVEPPPDLEHDDPPLPIQTDDATSSDTPPDTPRRVWTRQHDAISIDPESDIISDSGSELYNVYHARSIRTVIIMGLHTNMCMLRRSFTIKQTVRWGFGTILVRDLTDARYSPAQWPYVSHDEGTRLAVEYIEKFWCPSIASEQLLR